MKLVLQRIKRCTVTDDEKNSSSSNQGLFILCCIKRDITPDYLKIAEKVLSYKLFDNWTQSVKSKNYEIMLCSQFTLAGIAKGKKFSFHNSEAHEIANEKFNCFYDVLENEHKGMVHKGFFGKKCEIEVVLDGPVTIELEF